jgi:hypothetical protein
MTITAQIVADSISSDGIRLTTMQLRYPKFIHSEFMTHRVFSRNASSSRAIPVERMIEDVLRDPVVPSFWGKNQPGMQASGEINDPVTLMMPDGGGFGGGPKDFTRSEAWLEARDGAIEIARAFAKAGYHKQIVNRLLEPWAHINVVVTSTEFANFFALRCHPGAQPEMRLLAEAMRDARAASTPTLLQPGEWHLPYFDPRRDMDLLPTRPPEGIPKTWDEWFLGLAIKLSVARCDRVSYLTHEGKPPNVEEDLKLYDRLVGAEPLHASPAEHQATPDEKDPNLEVSYHYDWENPHEHGNFVGWRQFRKTLPNESVRDR